MMELLNATNVAIFLAIFLLIFFSIRQRWPERLLRWVRRIAN